MQNPYNYKSPVTNRNLFFGRSTVIAKIYSRIGADRPQSVSVVGEPKVGKSSLFWYLALEETRRAFLRNPDDYLFLYMSITLEKNLSFENFYISLYDLISKEASTITEVKEAEPSYDLFKSIVENLSQKNKKIILFFDDFHLITQNETFPLEFFSFLRSLANNFNLAFVTSSFLDLQQLCVSKDIEESPFFNIFTNITLKPFQQREAIQLIEEPFHNAGLALNAERELVLSMAGHFPFLLQVACNILFDLKVTRGNLERADLREWEARFCTETDSYFKSLWQTFDDDQQEILKLLMKSRRIDRARKYALDDLVRRNYVVMVGQRPQLYSPVFKKLIAEINGTGLPVRGRFFSWLRKLQDSF